MGLGSVEILLEALFFYKRASLCSKTTTIKILYKGQTITKQQIESFLNMGNPTYLKTPIKMVKIV